MTSYYRNEYLFSEIYLQEIRQQEEKEERGQGVLSSACMVYVEYL